MCILGLSDFVLFSFFFGRSMRLPGYRQFTWWIYNRLGKGCPRVIRPCVVCAIRNQYQDPEGNYTGFKDAEGNESWSG